MTIRFVASCALGLLVSATLAWPAAPQAPGDDQRARAARTAERLRTLQREADALAAQQRTLLAELRRLEVERQISIERLAQLDRDRREAEASLQAAEARAAELAQRAEALLPDVEGRLVHVYKLGRVGYWRLLLNSADMQALARAYRTAAALTAIDRARIAEYYATLDALASERKALQARADEIAALHAETTASRAALEKAVAERTALVNTIDARRDMTAQLIAEVQAADERLRATLAGIQSERPPDSAGALPLAARQGDLQWPVRGPVSRPFGRQPSGPAGGPLVRNGIEIAVTEGQPVRCVHEGTVAFADVFAGYGTLVIVDHGAQAYSLYGYLGSLDVSRGQRLPAGAPVGPSGRSPTGKPALYFELRIDGAAVDPVQWLVRQTASFARPPDMEHR